LIRYIFNQDKLEKKYSTKKQRKHLDFMPAQEDLNYIYKYPDTYKKYNKNAYTAFSDMFSKFPTHPEDVNTLF